MRTESRVSRVVDGSRLERTIVLQLLREDRDRRWSCTEIASALEADTESIEGAVGRLTEEGVLRVAEGAVSASPAARRLDALELICV